MLTLLISLLFSALCGVAVYLNGLGQGAVIGYSAAGFFISMFIMGYLIRKKATAVQAELQAIMTKGQNRMNNKIQHFQTKPGGNPAQMQRQLEADQKVMIKQALDFTVKLEPLKKWNFLMGRQIDTMRFQFLYQLKEFKQVDELLALRSPFAGPMFSEPILVAMKMARQYKNDNSKGAEKTYKKRIKWFRGERGTLLYALMSWIHMKNGNPDEARRVLLVGKEATENKVLIRNWEHLSNCNEKKFSNAGLADEWYTLYLETPVTPKQKRMRGNAKGAARF